MNQKPINYSKAPVPLESVEQTLLFNWAKFQSCRHKELDLMFAIPNGGFRHKATAKKMKAEGARPGVSDIMLPVARNGYHGLFIEMKRVSGGKESEAQESFREDTTQQGYLAVVCKGFDEAKKVLCQYLGIKESW